MHLMPEILFTKRALRDLKKISRQNKILLNRKLQEYSDNPLKYAAKLSNPKIGEYRYRIGHYRVIFDYIDDNIIFLRVGHRKDIYK